MCVLWDDCELWLLPLILHESKLTCRHCSDFFLVVLDEIWNAAKNVLGERERVYLQYITARRFKKLERESWFTAVYSLHSHISRATLLIGCDYIHTHTHLGVRGDYLCVSSLCSYTPLICPIRQKTNTKTCPPFWPRFVLIMCWSTLISSQFNYMLWYILSQSSCTEKGTAVP